MINIYQFLTFPTQCSTATAYFAQHYKICLPHRSPSANQREAKETDLSIHRNPQLQVPLIPQLTSPTPRLSPHQSSQWLRENLGTSSMVLEIRTRLHQGRPPEKEPSLTPSLGAQVQPRSPRGHHAHAGPYPQGPGNWRYFRTSFQCCLLHRRALQAL